MQQDDPVVRRVREARKAIVAECGNDIHKLYEWAKRIEAEHKGRIVRYDRANRRLDKVE